MVEVSRPTSPPVQTWGEPRGLSPRRDVSYWSSLIHPALCARVTTGRFARSRAQQDYTLQRMPSQSSRRMFSLTKRKGVRREGSTCDALRCPRVAGAARGWHRSWACGPRHVVHRRDRADHGRTAPVGGSSEAALGAQRRSPPLYDKQQRRERRAVRQWLPTPLDSHRSIKGTPIIRATYPGAFRRLQGGTQASRTRATARAEVRRWRRASCGSNVTVGWSARAGRSGGTSAAAARTARTRQCGRRPELGTCSGHGSACRGHRAPVGGSTPRSLQILRTSR